jgi:ubiquinone/menaquinone biosynthesis C-methylase UbiE
MKNGNPYDSVADWYEKTFGGSENRYIKKFAGLVPKGSTVLDLACGVGDDTRFLLKKGFRVVSVDSSKHMLAIARKKIPAQKFIQKNMTKVSYPEEYFSGTVLAFALQHVSKKESVVLLRKLHTMIKKNGVIYLALQEGKGIKKRTVNWNPKKEISYWVNMYTFQEISKILKSTGFNVIFRAKANPINKKAMQNKKLYVIARKV